MAINWGLALGQAAKSGLDTFTTLQEEQRKAEEAERRKQEFEWRAQEQRDQRAAAEAFKTTMGNVGNQDYTQAIQTEGGAGSQQAKMLADDIRGMGADAEKESALSVTNAMRGVTGKEAIAPEALKGAIYSEGQAVKDFTSKLAAAGVDPMKAMQLAKAVREDTVGKKTFELNMKRHDDYSTLAGLEQNNDVAGILKTFGPRYEAETGHKVSMGSDGNVVITDKKGKTIGTLGGDAKTLAGAVASQLQSHYDNQLSALNPEYGLKAREVKTKESTAQTEKEFKGKGGVYESVHDKMIAAQQGKSPTALYNEKVNVTAQALLDSGDAKTLAEARVKAAKMVLHAPAEIKGDANGNYVVGNKLYVPDPKNPGKFMEAQGFGPNSVVQAFANYDPNKAPNAAPKSALPVQSVGTKQMDAIAMKNGWKPLGTGGDMYFKLDANGEPIHRTGAALAKELGVLF